MTVTDPKLLPPPPGWIEPGYGPPRNGVQTCFKCGAAVTSPTLHTAWHREDVTAYRLVQASLLVMLRDLHKQRLDADAQEIVRWATGS